jgi:orotate phosphoribosyltransferase
MLCGDIAAQFRGLSVDTVIAPALGGIVVGQEVGRQLGVRTMFTERKENEMLLRRGFEISRGERVLVCEDVVTTGGSVNEVISIVRRAGAVVVGVGFIVDRSAGRVRFAIDDGGLQYPALTMDVVSFRPEVCPLCAQGIPAVKPGSRGMPPASASPR